MDANRATSFGELQKRYPDMRAIPAAELVRLFQEVVGAKGVKIGALDPLFGFNENVTHVIFFVKERGRGFGQQPIGNCVCLLIHSNGTFAYEMSGSLSIFWPIEVTERDLPLGGAGEYVDEIVHFLEHGKAKSELLYDLRDGAGNQRLHRVARSEEKCQQLGQVFGYQLRAGDG